MNNKPRQIKDQSPKAGFAERPSQQENDDFFKNSLAQLSIGAIAGMASRTGTAPLERLKILYQVQSHGKPPSIINGFKMMYAESGLRGMWKGNAANLLKIAPESAVKLYMFEAMKLVFKQWNQLYDSKNYEQQNQNVDEQAEQAQSDISATQLFMCGSIAGVCGHLVSFPLEVVKTRLAVAANGTYTGIVDCFSRTLRQEGFYSFYRGFTASMASTIPHSGINLMMYQLIRNYLVPEDMAGVNTWSTTLGLMVAGGASAMCSQVVIYPVRTIKARMIMHNMPGFSTNQFLTSKFSTAATAGSLPVAGPATAAATVVIQPPDSSVYRGGVIDIARATIKHEGVYGLYKGFYPSLLKTVPSNMIIFTVYGILRNVFGIEKPSKHK